jgi:hypothetical protein
MNAVAIVSLRVSHNSQPIGQDMAHAVFRNYTDPAGTVHVHARVSGTSYRGDNVWR